jgi:hypothetical protein
MVIHGNNTTCTITYTVDEYGEKNVEMEKLIYNTYKTHIIQIKLKQYTYNLYNTDIKYK